MLKKKNIHHASSCEWAVIIEIIAYYNKNFYLNLLLESESQDALGN